MMPRFSAEFVASQIERYTWAVATHPLNRDDRTNRQLVETRNLAFWLRIEGEADAARSEATAMKSPMLQRVLCLDLLSPGETFDHWCDLDAGHAGDHHCGDCGDVWNPVEGDEIDFYDSQEPHYEYEGTCPLCKDYQVEEATR